MWRSDAEAAATYGGGPDMSDADTLKELGRLRAALRDVTELAINSMNDTKATWFSIRLAEETLRICDAGLKVKP